MASIYPTTATDPEGRERVLWIAEADSGDILGTGESLEAAAVAAYQKLLGCIDVARRRGMPSRYINRLQAEAETFRPA